MFTKEFVEEIATKAERAEIAGRLRLSMNTLSIQNAIVEAECNKIENEHKELNKKALNYMFSFLPEEVVKQLEIRMLSGAFATKVTGKAAFNAELHIHLINGKTLHLKFDNEQKCLYYQSWINKSDLLAEHLIDNPSFNSWINL